MDVFGKGTDEPSRPLLPPGTCWICDNSPQQEEMKVIDTRRNTQAGGALSHASIRKYVCEPCVRQLGEAMGMVSAEVHAHMTANASEAMSDCVRLKHELFEAQAAQVHVVRADEVFDKPVNVSMQMTGEVSDALRTLMQEELAKLKPAPKPRAATAK